ncbi:MAG: CGGC domain-containing protein [Desulfobacterales bacterium]|nr:CGGC domain-containing protein [Desulfobacterales bacterium]
MKRIGILTCTNTTQDLGCSSFKCLEDVYGSGGEFKRYKEDGGAQLAGIINCAGCPTAVAPEKLLARVRSLTVLGVDAIHLSACVMGLCPFKNKYISLLEKAFPEIDIVRGTHDAPEGEAEMFLGWAKQTLGSVPNPMAELASQVMTDQKPA